MTPIIHIELNLSLIVKDFCCDSYHFKTNYDFLFKVLARSNVAANKRVNFIEAYLTTILSVYVNFAPQIVVEAFVSVWVFLI